LIVYNQHRATGHRLETDSWPVLRYVRGLDHNRAKSVEFLLCAFALIGNPDRIFWKMMGHLKPLSEIAGHADSRTTKLYDCRGQKVLLEDMERIRY
jgi:hypothetical protein